MVFQNKNPTWRRGWHIVGSSSFGQSWTLPTETAGTILRIIFIAVCILFHWSSATLSFQSRGSCPGTSRSYWRRCTWKIMKIEGFHEKSVWTKIRLVKLKRLRRSTKKGWRANQNLKANSNWQLVMLLSESIKNLQFSFETSLKILFRIMMSQKSNKKS